MGPTGAGVAQPVHGEVVLGARRYRSRPGIDAQLRPDPAHPAEVGRSHGQAVAVRGRLLRRQRSEHHAARRAGAVRDVHLPPGTTVGGVAGGRLVAAGDGRGAPGCWFGLARLGRRIPVGGQEQSVLADLHPRRLHRADSARAGRREPPRADRRNRREGAVVGELRARQTARHRPGQMAPDAQPAGVGQPEPSRARGGVQLVAVQPGHAHRLSRVRRIRRRWPPVAAGADRRLRRLPRGRVDPADARRAAQSWRPCWCRAW